MHPLEDLNDAFSSSACKNTLFCCGDNRFFFLMTGLSFSLSLVREELRESAHVHGCATQPIVSLDLRRETSQTKHAHKNSPKDLKADLT